MRVYRKIRGRRLLAAGAVAAILLGAGAAAAQGAGPQGGPRHGLRARCENPEPGARLAERLGLDEKQQEAVVKIREEGRIRDLALRKEIMRLRNELHGEMLKDNPAESKVLSLSDAVADMHKQLRGNRLKDQLAIRKILTPEQRDRMLMMGGPGGCGDRPGGWNRGPVGDLDDEQPEPDQE